MNLDLDDIIKSLPTERQAKIKALSDKKVEEMLAYAATLSDVRKAKGKTQAGVAKELGITQHAISQLENRSDTYISTLRRFLKSLGMTLELSVVAENGVRINLQNLFQGDESIAPVSKGKTLVKKSTALPRKIASAQVPHPQQREVKAAPQKRTIVASKTVSGPAKRKVTV